MSRKALRHVLFNDNIRRGGANTLRKSDVGKAEQLARGFGREIIDSQLGDPTRHGLTTYHRLNRIHTEICMGNEIRSAITDATQGEEWAKTREELGEVLKADDRVEAACGYLSAKMEARAADLSAKARLIGAERLSSIIGGFLADPLGATETSYHNSSGHAGLRRILAKRSGLGEGEGIDEGCVFIGCGVSGVVRALYKTLLKPMESASHEQIAELVNTITGTFRDVAGSLGEDGRNSHPWRKLQRKVADILEIVDERPEIIVPDACYPLYFAESTFAGARIVNIRMRREDGQMDLEELERGINGNTRAINLITVGNPIGIGMRKDVFMEALRIANRAGKDYGQPIFVVCDTIYEPFRVDRSERIEPLRLHRDLHREGGMDHVVVIDVSSISKMAAVPGGRIGWAKVSWLGDAFREERDLFLNEYMVNVQNPMLTPSAADWQAAAAEFFERLETDAELRADYEAFKAGRREECRRRTCGFIEGLMAINDSVVKEFGVAEAPIVFHPAYRINGRMREGGLDNWYVVFGFNKTYAPRDAECSGARRLAEFAAWSGEPGGGYAVPIFTPGSNFPFLVDAEDGQDYMRAVALFSDERRWKVLRTIEAYAQLITEAWSRR